MHFLQQFKLKVVQKLNDKYIICLPRQDLMPKQRMAEIGHLWVEWYLIYTLFTPFEGELPDEI